MTFSPMSKYLFNTNFNTNQGHEIKKKTFELE